MKVVLRSGVSSPSLGVMTFLNEVVQRFPHAISFAPGRPSDRFLNVREALDHLDEWLDYRVAMGGSRDQVLASLGQYGNTAGLIQELIAQHLATDVQTYVDKSSIVVTTGCQEAMLIAALTLLDPATDTLLVSDPSYIGMTGVAQLLGVPLHPVRSGSEGVTAQAVEDAIRAVTLAGRRPRALYDIPDFNNPLGTCMPVAERRELLGVAAQFGMVILEDNPYGAFAYDHEPRPTLKSLDRDGAVIYLGSFAKTLFPGLRIGYAVADQEIVGGQGTLARAMAIVKGLTTVNTSPITQAITGAALLAHGGSLATVVAARLPHYRANRDAMLASLATHFPAVSESAHSVSWNRPAGGFFLAVTLPFEFGTSQLERCANDYGVIVSPMSYFSLLPGRERQVRLSFSYVDHAEIEEGVVRFSRFVSEERQRPHHPTHTLRRTANAPV